MSDNEVESEQRGFCPSCGMPAVGGASFCGECGHSLVKTPTGLTGLPGPDAGQTETDVAAKADPVSTEPPGHESPPPGIIPSEADSAPKATKEKSRKRSILHRLVARIVATFSRPRASQSDSQSSSGDMGTIGTRAGTSSLSLDQSYRGGYQEGEAYAGRWASTGLMDIHHQGNSSRKDVQNGNHGGEEAVSASVVPSGVQT